VAHDRHGVALDLADAISFGPRPLDQLGGRGVSRTGLDAVQVRWPDVRAEEDDDDSLAEQPEQPELAPAEQRLARAEDEQVTGRDCAGEKEAAREEGRDPPGDAARRPLRRPRSADCYASEADRQRGWRRFGIRERMVLEVRVKGPHADGVQARIQAREVARDLHRTQEGASHLRHVALPSLAWGLRRA
jgi:hypothetical protein